MGNVLVKISRNQNLSLPMRKNFTLSFVIVALLVAFGSCRKFEGDQSIPAYLRIDSASLQTDYSQFGSNTHKITDSWVYVNDQLIGAFEHPATFPVLARGDNKLEIRPGIKLNGISATRVPYPFYRPFILTDFTFFEDSIVSVSPEFIYYDNTLIPWKEDFEDISISLEKTARSDTTIRKTAPHDPDAYSSEHSAYSGLIHLKGSVKTFQIATAESFALPGLGRPVFLEIDYKCDKPFGVGLIVEEFGTITFLPLVIVNTSEIWNKIYINLGPNISLYSSSARFKPYFEGNLDSEEEARFFFDNIKLVHR